MELHQTERWLLNSKRRLKLLKQLHQPMTASQLHLQVQFARRDCSDVIADMCKCGIVCCLNPRAKRSRLYGLTDIGQYWRGQFFPDLQKYSQPSDIDWNLYGHICFAHRKAIILALDQPRYPADIKRHARFCNPDIKMSSNNVRNIIPDLLASGIIVKIDSSSAYPMYDLTVQGRQLRHLLQKAVSNLQDEK